MITLKKLATGQGDDYTTDFLSDCLYFKEFYKMIGIDFDKQQELNPDPKKYSKFILL